MADELRWDDTDELAIVLTEKYPDINPREVPEICPQLVSCGKRGGLSKAGL